MQRSVRVNAFKPVNTQALVAAVAAGSLLLQVSSASRVTGIPRASFWPIMARRICSPRLLKRLWCLSVGRGHVLANLSPPAATDLQLAFCLLQQQHLVACSLKLW